MTIESERHVAGRQVESLEWPKAEHVEVRVDAAVCTRRWE